MLALIWLKHIRLTNSANANPNATAKNLQVKQQVSCLLYSHSIHCQFHATYIFLDFRSVCVVT